MVNVYSCHAYTSKKIFKIFARFLLKCNGKFLNSYVNALLKRPSQVFGWLRVLAP